MKFSVGYFPGCYPIIAEHREKISEIYFAYGGFANGRTVTVQENETYSSRQTETLRSLKDIGIKTNLLLNGTCYGAEALSRELFERIGDTVDELQKSVSLAGVTTTSPLIARFIKENFPDIKTRASVNMNIGSVCGMEYVSNLFDEFYLSRDDNRDLAAIRAARAWCDDHGKKLYGLANSGCLLHCSAHSFHDNLVSHEREAMKKDNAYLFEGQCRTYLADPAAKAQWIRHTTWIRPEDTHLYEELFDGLKLATRVHADPERVIRAYAAGHYSGSLPALFEPDHSALFYPNVIENAALPENFGKTVLQCDKKCTACGYCDRVQAEATKSLISFQGGILSC